MNKLFSVKNLRDFAAAGKKKNRRSERALMVRRSDLYRNPTERFSVCLVFHLGGNFF